MLRFQIPAAYGINNAMYTLAELKMLNLENFYNGLKLCCKAPEPTDCLSILQKAKCYGTTVSQLNSYFEYCFRQLCDHYTDLNEIGDAHVQKSVTTYIWSKISALKESNLPLVTKLSWCLHPHRSSVSNTFIQAFTYLRECSREIEKFEASGLMTKAPQSSKQPSKQPVAPINSVPQQSKSAKTVTWHNDEDTSDISKKK